LRKSLAYTLSASLLLPLLGHALTLGNLAVTSHLNQKFVAEIPLSNLHHVKPTSLKVTIASEEMHKRLNVSRPDYLQQFNFKIITQADGTPVIRINSKQKLDEPFIQFLLTVHWPNGKLLKQYTVLLDPPPSNTQTKPAMGHTQRKVAPKPTVTQPKMKKYGPVPMFSNLLRVAKEVRPDDSVTIEQVAVVILQFNQRAFIRGNMNGLKAGYTLQIPPVEQIRTMSQKQARAEFKRQNIAWRNGQIIKVAKPIIAAAKVSKQGKANKSTAPEKAQTKNPKAMKMASLANKVDLNYGNTLAPSLVPHMTKQQTPKVISLTPTKQANPLETNAQVSAQTQSTVNQMNVVKSLQQQQSTIADNLAMTQQINTSLRAELRKMSAQQKQLTLQYQQQQKDMKTLQSQLSAATPSNGEVNDSWLFWYLLMGVLGVSVLGGGALLLFYRRYADHQSGSILFNELFPEQGGAKQAMSNTLSDEQTIDEGHAQDADKLDVPSKNQIRLSAKSEQVDVIEEARVYEAYERLPQAKAMLEGAVLKLPDRVDLKIELLRILRLMKNENAYNEIRQQIPAVLEKQQPELWQQLQTIEQMKMPENQFSENKASEIQTPSTVRFDDLNHESPVYDMDLNDISKSATSQVDDNQVQDNKKDENIIEFESGLAEELTSENTSEQNFSMMLEIAKEHIFNRDNESAERLLKSVLTSGNSQQKAIAESMLKQIKQSTS